MHDIGQGGSIRHARHGVSDLRGSVVPGDCVTSKDRADVQSRRAGSGTPGIGLCVCDPADADRVLARGQRDGCPGETPDEQPTSETPAWYHGGRRDKYSGKVRWSVVIDGIYGTALDVELSRLKGLISSLVGHEPEQSRGAHGYTHAWSWGEGVYLWHGGESQKGTCHAAIAGHVVEHRSWSDQIEILRSVGLNMTRLDVAVDVWGFDRLLTAFRSWARSAWIRRFRRISDHSECMIEGSSPVSRGGGLYLGAPSSNLRVLVYDKGAELGGPADESRVRIELRSRREAARSVAAHLITHPGEIDAAAVVMGVLEVTDDRGCEPQMLADLKAMMCGTDPVVVPRDETALGGFVAWARKAVGGRLAQMAWISGHSVPELASMLFAGIPPAEPRRLDRCLEEFSREQRFAVGDTIE